MRGYSNPAGYGRAALHALVAFVATSGLLLYLDAGARLA